MSGVNNQPSCFDDLCQIAARPTRNVAISNAAARAPVELASAAVVKAKVPARELTSASAAHRSDSAESTGVERKAPNSRTSAGTAAPTASASCVSRGCALARPGKPTTISARPIHHEAADPSNRQRKIVATPATTAIAPATTLKCVAGE